MIRYALKTWIVLALTHGLGACGPDSNTSPRASDERPNIVLLISDDQDYEHLGFAGHPLVETPAIDRLAREGAVFPITYAQSRCRPTLAGLLSGLSPRHSGVHFNLTSTKSTGWLTGHVLFPQLLHDAGYETYSQGKLWEPPHTLGFNNVAKGAMLDFVRSSQDEVFEFLDNVGERPFFMWWAPKLPHVPHDPPTRLLESIDRASIRVPDWVAAQDRAEFVELEATSLAMAAWLDEGVAQLMHKLEERDLRENTLVMFLIDNGWANAHVSKGSPFEKGLRTPLILSWPGHISAEQELPQLVSYLDIMPTILDYAGVEVPGGLAGRSLRRLVEGVEGLAGAAGEDGPWRERLIGAVYPGIVSDAGDPRAHAVALYLRDDRFKYVLWRQDVLEKRNDNYFRIKHILLDFPSRRRGDQELYDLEADPYERHNLAGDPDQGERLRDCNERVQAWWARDASGR